MHRPESIFETLDQVGLNYSNLNQPSIHQWLRQTIVQLSRKARSTDTTCIASETSGHYYITHGQTTHHFTAYEAYRFLQSILWLYDLDED
jgi:hypothetical protein